MTLRELARQILSNAHRPLSAGQIWDLALQQGLDKQLQIKGKTPQATMGAYLYTAAKQADSGIVATGKNPVFFSLASGNPPEPAQSTSPLQQMSVPRMWGIHSLNDDLFRRDNLIAIGWKAMGNLASLSPNRDAFKTHLETAYPGMKKAAIPNIAGMLYRFAREVQLGDFVVYPSKQDRQINIGVVQGNYEFDPSSNSAHQRKVKWLKHLSRDVFSPAALYEVGSAMTFFAVRTYAEEFARAIRGNAPIPEPDAPVPLTPDAILDTTKDFILKELSTHLKGFELEDFVENLLQAMGYRTTRSKKGGDGGVDITAYKDELPPRILVQVKSQTGDIDRTLVAQLKGDMRPGDYGLFVTLSNYKPSAQTFLNENPILRGINGSELADLILKYYANLDERFQKIIPLKMVYVPSPISPDDEGTPS